MTQNRLVQKPDPLLTFTRLPDVTIRRPQRSARISTHVAILKIKSTVKIPPAPDPGKVIQVSLISEKARPRSTKRVKFRPPGCLKRTHTHLRRDCAVSRSWGRRGGRFSGSEDDWQKMSGTTRQPHTDTQQADVRDCMIRRRAGSQGNGRKWHLQRVMSSSQNLFTD